jgi:Domain of unknown function (DUF4184)
MPFTLAHPAAVLPLKRFCPRHLSFSALVVGSMVPDVGYLFSRFKVDEFAHTFVGSFGFSLPVGMLMLGAFYGFRRRIVALLPDAQRRIFMPLCLQPLPSVMVMVVSVLMGAWTHLFWDSFTHRHGWLVNHLPVLQLQIMQWGYHRVLLCDVIECACSFGGVVVVGFAYEKWVQTANQGLPRASFQRNMRNALFIGLLFLPIEALHQMSRAFVGLALVGVCSLAVVIGIMFGLGNPLPERSQKQS